MLAALPMLQLPSFPRRGGTESSAQRFAQVFSRLWEHGSRRPVEGPVGVNTHSHLLPAGSAFLAEAPVSVPPPALHVHDLGLSHMGAPFV